MRIGTAFLMAALAGVVGCSHRGRQTASVNLTDADLQRTVQSRLAGNSQLNRIDVSADADLNRVTLSGMVPGFAARANAVDLAKSDPLNPMVVDRMEVRR